MRNPLSLKKLLFRSVTSGRRTPPARRLALDTLEARITPATHTWTNLGPTNNWSDAGNWGVTGVPTTGEAGGTLVVIPINDSTINQDIVGLVIGQLQFSNPGSSTLTVVTPLGLDGSTATNNVVNSSGTNTVTGSALNLTGSTAFISVVAGSTLAVSSQLTGTQGFRKTGAGAMTLTGTVANTYAGVTTVADGTLALNTVTADAGLSNSVVVGDGTGAAASAVLQLLGGNEIPDLASVTVNSDGQLSVVAAAFEDITALTLNAGAVSIAAGGGFTIRSGGSVTTVPAATSSTVAGPGTLFLVGSVVVTVPDGAAATDLLISAVVGESAAGSGFVKSGAGTLELAGTVANTYTGATAVNDGVLALNNNAANGAVGLSLVIGDGVGAAGSAVVRLLQNTEIPDAAAVTLHSDGRLDLNGFADTIGLLSLDNGATVTTGVGTLVLADNVVVTGVGPSAPAFVSGKLALGAASRTFAVADGPAGPDAVIAAVISGSGGLVKSGPGFLTLAGANTYTGTTLVTAGTLEVAGVQSASAVTLTGGTLGGAGTVGPLTATGGTVAPGLGLATAPVTFSTGNLALGLSAYTPLIVGTAGGASDRVAVTGTVNLTGATLTPTRTGLPVPVGTPLLIVTNDGVDPVVGTFAGLPQGATLSVGGQTFTVSYTAGDGNDVALTATNSAPTISDVPNQPASGVGVAVGPLAFTVGDAETAPAALVVTAASSNLTLVPLSGITFGGSGAARTVTVTPAAGQSGTATVTLTVTDAGGLTATDSFTVTVTVAAPSPVLVGVPQFAAGTDAGGTGTATLYNADKSVRFAVSPFGAFAGGVRVAAGDFTGDGVADLVVGTGPGAATQVVVIDGVTQKVLFSLNPFEAAFTGGVYVAAGDLNGDGVADLVITPDEGGGPRVRVFSGKGFTQIADFFGIDDPAFRGGARAAVADLSGDGVGDLVVSAGFGGGPRVAAFNGLTLGAAAPVKLFPDILVFEPALRNGAFVAAGDLNGDGFAELIAGGGPGGGPRVTAFDGKSLLGNVQTAVTNFFAGDTASRGGVRVAVKNLDGDGRADLFVGAGTAAGSRVTAYAGKSITSSGTPPELFAFDAVAGFAGGVFVG